MRNVQKKPVLITGLDIGSSKISAVTAEITENGLAKIAAHASLPSKGITRGIVMDLDAATRSTSRALGKIKEKLSVKRLDNIYVNISGQTIKAERSRGMIPLSIRGREITRGDMERCINVASTVQLPFDRDIIHRIVQNFSIDDQPSIKDPLGMYGSRLACEMFVISANANHIQNIYKCVNEAGYDIKDIVFTGIAEGMSVLTTEEKRAGSAILNIGASLTETSVFSGGVLTNLSVVGRGSQDFKGEITSSAELDTALAAARACAGDVGTIVLTGGLAFSDGIIEFLENKLARPVRLGIARDAKGDISSTDSIRLTTAIGLARYGEETYKKRIIKPQKLIQQITSRVVDIFNNYF